MVSLEFSLQKIQATEPYKKKHVMFNEQTNIARMSSSVARILASQRHPALAT